MNETAWFAALIGSFAVTVTAHVTILVGLARRPPRWRAAAALMVPPLAPYFALRERMRVRAALWIVAAVVYLLARR